MAYLRALRQRIDLTTASVLLAFCTVAVWAGVTLAMLLMRHTNRLFADTMLSHYFAYWQDLPAAALVLALLLALLFVPGRSHSRPMTVHIGILAGAVLILCYAGTYAVFGDYPLSFDEYMANFDAEIFRHGQILAPLPSQWRAFAPALQPEFMQAPEQLAWSSSYLPVNAAIRSIFVLAGDASLSAPVLATASVVLVYAIVRKLMPDDREAAVIGALLLATSAQFLITAMTPYAMTAHLAFNLLWLWLVLHDRRWALLVAACVSFLATGLHQLVFHPLFVAPFLPWLWFTGRRWAPVLLAAALLVATAFWAFYPTLMAQSVGALSSHGAAQVPLVDKVEALVRAAWRPVSLAFMADNILRLTVWQNPFLWVLATMPFLAPRRQSSIVWPLAAGAIATFGAVMLLLPYQGHGWGYRYLHGFLGSFALLAVFGWKTIRSRAREQEQRLRTCFGLAAITSIVVLLPLHAVQAYRFTAPYRDADALISQLDAEVVIIEDRGRWFSQDLVRNDPFLRNRPLRLLARKLPWREVQRLCSRYRVGFVDRTNPDLRMLRPLAFKGELQSAEQRRSALGRLGCSRRGS